MPAPHYQLIKQADQILSKCGRPISSFPGQNIVPFQHGILIQGTVGNDNTFVLTKEIPGDVPFLLRAIQAPSPTGLYINLQLPNGKYLFNREQEISQFQGIGSFRYVIDPEWECPPGSTFELTLDNSVVPSGGTVGLVLMLEGALKYSVKGKNPAIQDRQLSVSDLPRYVKNPNQNILAPAWMQGYYPNTPDSCEDSIFTYGDGNLNFTTMNVGTGPYSATQQINISSDSDFICSRALFDVRQVVGGSSPAGTFLARLRAGSGYSLMDDLIDVAQYINGSPFAHSWHIKAGDQVFVDLQLVDFSGSGSLTIETYLDGLKRKRR